MPLMKNTICVAAALAAMAASPAVGRAQEARSTTEYSVRYFGLPIASLSFTTTTSGRAYTIKGRLRSSGLIDIIEKTRGTTAVSGHVDGDRLQASHYVVDYTSGKKQERTEITYRDGNVLSARQTPPPKKHGDKWIPLGKDDLKDVLDPISGMIFPAGSPVCPRTLPMFDGETRADLRLEPKGRERFYAGDYSGDAVACSVRFVPKAGYRKGNDSIDFLAAATSIEVWFAKTPSADFYAPVYARVPTRIGPVTVRATHFGD